MKINSTRFKYQNSDVFNLVRSLDKKIKIFFLG